MCRPRDATLPTLTLKRSVSMSIYTDTITQSFLKIRNENIYLGTFDTIEDAIMARKKAEKKYHGEFVI
jgi:hypothetical protein